MDGGHKIDEVSPPHLRDVFPRPGSRVRALALPRRPGAAETSLAALL